MSAQILDGKLLAAEMRAELKEKVGEFFARTGVRPGLGVLLVGDNPASVSYVTAKEKACHEAGIASFEVRLPGTATESEIVAEVEKMNLDPAVHGILVQLPLPKGISEDAVIEAISPEKDVDGFTPENVGRMMIGRDCFLPCTPHGIIKLLLKAGVKTSGAHAVVVGRSNIVGKPVAHLLMRKGEPGNATVTVCHTGTVDLARYTKEADILVVAAGRAGTVTGEMVKPGATVIDVGVNRIADERSAKGYRLCGDVDFDSVKEVASAITPVPGGVGPMTITMLLVNTLQAAGRAVAKGV